MDPENGGAMRWRRRRRTPGWLLAWALGVAATGWAQTEVLPSAIAFDAQGDVYFADAAGHVVREFSAVGVLTTVAGTGVQGFGGDGGAATSAELDSPGGVAVDAAGNLYIADTHNQRVREVAAATGAIATIAGAGVAGFAGDGGAATSAELDMPTALAVDAAGNVYVADMRNHRVRRIAAGTRTISTVAGTGVQGFGGDGGPATAAELDSPDGLAVDSSGNLYIADTRNGRLRKVSAATSTITTVAGAGAANGSLQAFGGDGGAATAARFALPRGIALDSAGNVYVADSANHRVRRIAAGTGTISTVAGDGTEAFLGDGAPAVSASLDGPRAVAISPAGLLTLTDTENARVRQLDALPAPGPDIHTLVGLGAGTGTDSLALGGPATTPYGSGTVTATLSATGTATGSVSFVDTVSGAPVALGTAALTANVASESTASLAAGAHTLVATYAGDATHAAAQSAPLAMTVTPLTLTATPDPVTILYGQPVPALTGTLSGVLAQDAGKVSAVFTTAAGVLAPVGSYPISAALSGSSAANYTVALAPASVMIAQAPTLTTLLASASAPVAGAAVTLSVQAASTTSGVPTGSVTLLDGTGTLGTVQLTAGAAALTTSALAAGAHSLTAVYSGDGNFLGSTSAAAIVTVGAGSGSGTDFTLAATGAATQTVPAGDAVAFSFSIGGGAALSSPINLAVQGTPPGAIASFNPAYIPPGGAVTGFTLTIQTPAAVAKGRGLAPLRSRALFPAGLAAALLIPVLGVGFRRGRGKRMATLLLLLAACGLMEAAVGCGDRINTAAETADAASYPLTVTATATSASGTSLQHSVNVTLEVIGN